MHVLFRQPPGAFYGRIGKRFKSDNDHYIRKQRLPGDERAAKVKTDFCLSYSIVWPGKAPASLALSANTVCPIVKDLQSWSTKSDCYQISSSHTLLPIALGGLVTMESTICSLPTGMWLSVLCWELGKAGGVCAACNYLQWSVLMEGLD